jgi:hypothetical protein
LVIDSGGRSILLSLNPRAAPKVKGAFRGSDICHAFSHFYRRLEEDLKQGFEFSKLLLKTVVVIDRLKRRTKW